MNTQIIYTGCKINTYLEITGILPNGYHRIKSLMIPLDFPQDKIEIEIVSNTSSCTVKTDSSIIDPEDNTLTKAYNLFLEHCPGLPGIDITLTKNIPIGAGLGGGSANAAGVIKFLNSALYELGFDPLKEQTLNKIASKVGADVPFFINNTSAWVEGIGDELTSIPNPYANYYLVLICPQVHISTALAYADWNNLYKNRKIQLTSPLDKGTKLSAGTEMFNTFEQVIFPKHPRLALLKDEMLRLGATKALMSGSGSSIFGLFEDEADANRAKIIFDKSQIKCFKQFLHAGV